MKAKDFLMILFLAAIFLPFVFLASLFEWYIDTNEAHGILMAMLKFGILATAGEMIGLRIRTGNYWEEGFGIIPRAVIWALLGVTIALAFKIFAAGAPRCLEYLGVAGAVESMGGGFTPLKLLTAFSISLTMNLVYAPIMMTLHKITDTHIDNYGGHLRCLVSPVPFGKILSELNWDVQWGFVFKKTIPFFWIPAHTITFLLPEYFQVLFAAILGIVLGVILAFAANTNKK